MRTRKTEEKAEACGMTVEQWVAAREQARVARSRGRRPPRMASDPHAPIEGQMAMFEED
jgi:hypothetical protein